MLWNVNLNVGLFVLACVTLYIIMTTNNCFGHVLGPVNDGDACSDSFFSQHLNYMIYI